MHPQTHRPPRKADNFPKHFHTLVHQSKTFQNQQNPIPTHVLKHPKPKPHLHQPRTQTTHSKLPSHSYLSPQ